MKTKFNKKSRKNYREWNQRDVKKAKERIKRNRLFRHVIKFSIVFIFPLVFFVNFYIQNIRNLTTSLPSSGSLVNIDRTKIIDNFAIEKISDELLDELEVLRKEGELPLNTPPNDPPINDFVFGYFLSFLPEDAEKYDICLKNHNEYSFNGRHMRDLKIKEFSPERAKEVGAMSMSLYLPSRPAKKIYAKHHAWFPDCEPVKPEEIPSGFFTVPEYASQVIHFEDERGKQDFPDHVDLSKTTLKIYLDPIVSVLILASGYALWWGFILLFLTISSYVSSRSWLL